MKTLKYLLSGLILISTFSGCKKEINDDVSFVETTATSAKLGAMFTITQDNTGLVTITPNGEGVASFEIAYGHGTAGPVKVLPGGSTSKVYPEGVYDVKITGTNVAGVSTTVTQKLTVTFRAPENLDVTAVIDPANKYKVNVSAKALYETFFQVYFGDVANEVPTNFLEGQTISKTYAKTGSYTVRVVALSGGAATTTFTKVITIVDPVVLPVTFESTSINYAWNDFSGGNVSVVANPHSSAANASTRVAKMVKNAGDPWGGSWIGLGGPIDFSANKVFRMKVFSPRVGAKVLLKVENAGNGSMAFEKEVLTTVANAWEDLAFDYRTINAANEYHNIVVIFDNGTPGDGSANFTFYMDDIRLTDAMPNTKIDLPVTFDVQGVNYTVTDFGNNQTVDAVDPNDANNKVKKTTKVNGAETWAGTTIGTSTGFATAIPLTAASSQMSVRVYSPAAGIRVLLKVEDHTNGQRSVETFATTTMAGEWETLIFDFNNQAPGTAAFNATYTYDMASIFFDFGNSGNGKVFYWDDVRKLSTNFVESVSLPLTFESNNLTYTWNDFDGGVVTVVNNPQSGGINTSAKVGKMVKNAGQIWGGSWIGLAAPIDFSTKKTFKVKVFSPRAGAKLLLKVENQSNGAISFEKEVTTTVAGGWETLSFDYSAINTANTYQKIVLIFDLGTVGDGSANFTFLFDDITLN
ncbi:MAG: hypothetical protein LW718_05355 [Sediminibacterium sp.]|nr:hypothetical protein [Sediminibacterium sp.]